jgi:hypothetical protein
VTDTGAAPTSDDSVDSQLAELAAAADALADRVSRVAASEWNRTGHRVDDGSVTALDVVADAVARAVDHLRTAERTMAEMSRNQSG